jgi:hypothetical protein
VAEIWRTRDRAGRAIILASAGLNHILQGHDEIADRLDEVRRLSSSLISSLAMPDIIIERTTIAEWHLDRACSRSSSSIGRFRPRARGWAK